MSARCPASTDGVTGTICGAALALVSTGWPSGAGCTNTGNRSEPAGAMICMEHFYHSWSRRS